MSWLAATGLVSSQRGNGFPKRVATMAVPPLLQQERRDSCGLACLRMVLAYYDTTVEEKTLELEAHSGPGGIEIEKLSRVASLHGLDATIESLNLERIAD